MREGINFDFIHSLNEFISFLILRMLSNQKMSLFRVHNHGRDPRTLSKLEKERYMEHGENDAGKIVIVPALSRFFTPFFLFFVAQKRENYGLNGLLY